MKTRGLVNRPNMQRFCKFCTNIEKHGLKLIKAIVTMALTNLFSVFSNKCSKVLFAML